MAHLEFNWLAMLVAAVASLLLGWVWFGPLFGKKWAAEMGMEMPDQPDMKAMAKPMVMHVVGAFLVAYGMTWFIGGNAGHWEGYHMALMPGLLAWGGFYVPMHISEVAWQERSWNLFGINASHSLVNLLIIVTILHFM